MPMGRGVSRHKLFESREACKRLREGQIVAVQKFTAGVERDAAGAATAGKLAFVISDASKDRYGDTIAADGWNFEAFTKNPVLMYAHDYRSLPLGRMGTPWKTNGNRIKAEVEEFATADENPMAAPVESMLRRGLLNAVSVGFLPMAFDLSPDGGIDYTEQELLEVSVVPVPANANALLQAKSAGLWVRELDQWVEKQLDERHEGIALELARQAHAVLSPVQVAVQRELDAQPLPEVLENTRALNENTAAVRELLLELRQDRAAVAAERAAAQSGDRVANIAAAVRSMLKL